MGTDSLETADIYTVHTTCGDPKFVVPGYKVTMHISNSVFYLTCKKKTNRPLEHTGGRSVCGLDSAGTWTS